MLDSIFILYYTKNTWKSRFAEFLSPSLHKVIKSVNH